MKHLLWGVLTLLLAVPAAWGQDKPKDEKKPLPPKERFTALVKEYAAQRTQIVQEAQKANAEERQKLIEKLNSVRKDFADKFYTIAEENPKDPAATDAVFWIAQNGAGSKAYDKAIDKVIELVKEMPLKDLTTRLQFIGSTPKIVEVVYERAEKNDKDPEAPKLLVWIASRAANQAIGEKATQQLIKKHADSAELSQLFRSLSYRQNGEKTLKEYLEQSDSDRIKALAALNLGRLNRSNSDRRRDQKESDKLAAEAEKYLVMVVEQYGKNNPAELKAAQRELNIVRNLRVGKQVLDIAGPDLDGKEFKLSEYRGKVVLLDFWGNW